MALYNRIKCAATIDSSGAIILGAAAVGFRALPTGWGETDGEYPYLLEDSTNHANWELGLVLVAAGAQATFSGKKRKILDSSSGSGFASLSTDLVFSQGPTPSGVWAGGVGTSAEAPGTNQAAGDGAAATGGYAIAIGYTATATGGGAVAIGIGALAEYPREVSLGGSRFLAASSFIPMQTNSNLAPGATSSLDTSTASIPINFASWCAANRNSGYLHASGRIVVRSSSDTTKAASMVVSFEYTLWVGVNLSQVVGTPTFTTIFNGGSVSATFGVHASTGAITVTNSGASYVKVKAAAHIDSLGSW